jgi:hypothetical protein
MTRVLVTVLVVAFGIVAFLGGRASKSGNGASYHSGYLAGREDAFGNFDGGWGYGEPYIVELKRGSPQITYAIADRVTMEPGLEYRVCGRKLCTRPAR